MKKLFILSLILFSSFSYSKSIYRSYCISPDYGTIDPVFLETPRISGGVSYPIARFTSGDNYYYKTSCDETVSPPIIYSWCDVAGKVLDNPQCADNYTQAQCDLDGLYWRENRCYSTPLVLTPEEQCLADGDYWYNSSCHSEPEPVISACASNADSSLIKTITGEGLSSPSTVCLTLPNIGNCSFTKNQDLGTYSDDSAVMWSGVYAGAGEECQTPTSPPPVDYVPHVPFSCPSGMEESGSECVLSNFEDGNWDLDLSILDSAYEYKFTNAYNSGSNTNGNWKVTVSGASPVVVYGNNKTYIEMPEDEYWSIQELEQYILSSSPYLQLQNVPLKGTASSSGPDGSTYIQYYTASGLRAYFSNNKIYLKPMRKRVTVTKYEDGSYSVASPTLTHAYLSNNNSNSILNFQTGRRLIDDPDPDPDPVGDGSCDPDQTVCPSHIQDQTDQLIEGLVVEDDSIQENTDSLDTTFEANQSAYETDKDSFSSDSDILESDFVDESEGFFSDFSDRFLVIFEESADTTGIPYTFDADRNIQYITHEDTSLVRMFGHIVMFLGLVVFAYHRLLAKPKEMG